MHLSDWRYLPTAAPFVSAILAGISAVKMLFGDGEGATPTTILGAFIVIALGALSLIGWIVREQFKQQEAASQRAEAKDIRIDRTITLLESSVQTSERLATTLEELVRKIPQPSGNVQITPKP